MDRHATVAHWAGQFRARAALGDLSGTPGLLAALATVESPLGQAWSCAVRSQVWLMSPAVVSLPTEAEVAALVPASSAARRVAALAARDVCLARFLSFDRSGLERWTAILERLVTDDAGARDLVIASALRGLLGARSRSCGEAAASDAGVAPAGEPTPADLQRLAAWAAKDGHTLAAVEAEVLGALLAIEAEDRRGGLELARRATRSARASAIPEAELLAGMALARARRRSGQVHLAVQVLGELRRVVTPPWRGWLAWESVLAGVAPAELPASPATAAEDLAALLAAADDGDRAAWAAARASLQARLDGGVFRREADEVTDALAPDDGGDPVPPPEWRRGESDTLPAGVQGLALAAGAGTEPLLAAAIVVARPGARGIRVLPRALPLASTASVVRIRRSRRREGRVETLLAVLALAGPDGLKEDRCFAGAYGFPFLPGLHAGAFEALIRRARTAAGPAASVVRQQGKLALIVSLPLAVPDPRISQRTADRVLAMLAQRRRTTVKQAASQLGISLRSARAALDQLAANGACVIEESSGRNGYAIEPVVFSAMATRLAAGAGAGGGDSGPSTVMAAGAPAVMHQSPATPRRAPNATVVRGA
jgi:hypothetical protein